MESSKQVASIQELTERIERLEKNEQETWDMLGQFIDYINITAEERKAQLNQLIKEIYECKLKERYKGSYPSNTNRYNTYKED